MVSLPNVLTNANGGEASISLAPTAASFSLSSFYATPIFVDTLSLTVAGITVEGAKLSAQFSIVNPQRTQVHRD